MKRFLVLFVVMVLGLQLHAQDIDDVAMMVGNKLVTLDEFVYAYQKNQLHAHGSLDRFLKDFKNRKIKVAYAESLGYDTLTAVRRKLENVQQNLAQGTLVGGNLRDGALHGQSLYIGHLFLAAACSLFFLPISAEDTHRFRVPGNQGRKRLHDRGEPSVSKHSE